MGKTIIKFLSITFGILAVIIIALTVFIKIYITPERIKALLVPQAEKALNRKVEIGEVSISLLKGISVTDFAIREADEKTDFVSCKDFVLKFKLLPLLSKRVIIDELRLDEPKVRIERNAEGRFNFDDIGKKKTEESKEPKKTEEPGGMPVSLLISDVSVHDSSFSLIDHTKDIPDMSGSLSVEMRMQPSAGGELISQGNIDLMLAELTRWKPVKKTIKNIGAGIQYSARVNPDTGELVIENADLKVQNIQASIKGNTKNLTSSPDIDITLSMEKIKTEDVQDLLSSFIDLQGLSLSGLFTAEMKIKGRVQKIDTLTSATAITLEKVGVTYNKVSTSLEGTISVSTSSDNLSLDNADLKIQDIPATIKGTLKNLRTSPYLDIAASVPRVKAAALQQAAAPFTDIMGVDVSGALIADFQIKGALKELSAMNATGSLNLEKIGINYHDIHAMLDGGIVLKKDLMTVDLNTTVGENSATIKGSVNNLFKNQDINLNVYSSRLNIDKLILPPAKEKAEPASVTEGTASKKTLKEPEPLDLKLTAHGEIKVDSAVYKGLNMKNFVMQYDFRNNKLNVTKLSGAAGKGTFDLISITDLSKKGYGYSLSGKVDSLYAEEIINAFFPKYKDTIYGIISTNLKVSGKGTLPENIKRNLAGNADFTIRDGKITNMPMLSNLAAILNTGELETINVKRGDGKITITNGLAKLDSMISSDDVEMDPKGDIGLVDESLDLAFDLRLSPRIKGKAMSSSYSDYLSDKAGWGMIPVRCPGTFSTPRCGPDLAKAGKRAVEKEIDKQIDKIFKKKEGEESPEAEAVKGLLKGILGK